MLDLVTRGEKVLDARKHKFLQVRMGRDERPDLFSDTINDGIMDYWERFEKPLYAHLLYVIVFSTWYAHTLFERQHHRP